MLSFNEWTQQRLNENFQSSDIDSVSDYIKKNCSQFLTISKEYGKVVPLYRGISKNSEKSWVDVGVNPNRGSTGLSRENHDSMQELFKDKFHTPFLNGTFTTGSKIQADEYGHVYGGFSIRSF